MYAAARRTDERAFEVDPENLRRESRLGIARAANVTRDAAQGCAQVSSGGAVTVVATSDVVPRRATVEAIRSIASRRAFHHVVAAGAVNVHVNETRNDDHVARRKMFRILRDANFVAMADLR